MGRSAYTPEQRAWLRERYAGMTNAELAEAFNARFPEAPDATPDGMRAFGQRSRLRKSAEARSRALSKYTPEMLDWLRGFIPGHHEGEISEGFEREFGVALSIPMVGNLKAKLGVRSGTVGGRFTKGQAPHNKGRPWDEWMPNESRAAVRENLFKPGHLSGSAAKLKRPLLDVREGRDGYLQIKVAPRNIKHHMQNWISLASFVWMQANGREWPEGHRAVFADHDNRNFDPGNIVPVPEDIYPIVTGGAHGHALSYHDRESLELAVLHARVMRERTRLQLRERECPECGQTFAPEYASQVRCRPCIERRRYGYKRKGRDGQ